MSTSDTTNDTLNDLVKIQNDRINGYKHAMDNLADEDADLKMLFTDMMAQSQEHKLQLAQAIIEEDGIAQAGGTNSGSIYQSWVNFKAGITGKDRKSILKSCVYGEEAAQKSYEHALGVLDLTSEAQEVIVLQMQDLKKSLFKVSVIADAQV